MKFFPLSSLTPTRLHSIMDEAYSFALELIQNKLKLSPGEGERGGKKGKKGFSLYIKALV
jgi:hypothetical protein